MPRSGSRPLIIKPRILIQAGRQKKLLVAKRRGPSRTLPFSALFATPTPLVPRHNRLWLTNGVGDVYERVFSAEVWVAPTADTKFTFKHLPPVSRIIH